MKRLKRWVSWFVTSSADPIKYSLFLRGIGGVAIAKTMTVATALCGLHMGCIGLEINTLNWILEGIVMGVEYTLYLVSLCATVYGGARKLIYVRWAHYSA